MNKNELLSYYVAFLRTLYLVNQNNHWLSNGENFYGNHLLFERIYKSAQENADEAAERFIGMFGMECLDFNLQSKYISEIFSKCTTSGLQTSLHMETNFLKFAEEFYEKVSEFEEFSLGLDDLIMKISDDRESAVYLLRQALGGKSKNIEARKNYFSKLLK